MVEALIDALIEPPEEVGFAVALLTLRTPLYAPTLPISLPIAGREVVVPLPSGGTAEAAVSEDRGAAGLPVIELEHGQELPIGLPAIERDHGSLIGIVGASGFSDFSDARLLWLPSELEMLRADVPPPADAGGAAADIEPGPPPSARVHTDRWTVTDQLDYELYAAAIAEFIRHRDTRPPLVISVQGPWGQGKTSLMRMVQRWLDPSHPELREQVVTPQKGAAAEGLTYEQTLKLLDGEETHERAFDTTNTVWFNAWKYQSSDALWAGMAYAILDQLPARLSRIEYEKFWLKLHRRRIDAGRVRAEVYRLAFERVLPWLVRALVVFVCATLALVIGVLDELSGAVAAGGAVVAAGLGWLRSYSTQLGRPLEGSFARFVRQPDYEARMGFLHEVEQDLRDVFDLLAPDESLVIFIDDLDRCAPAKIAEVLEAINLFLAGEYPGCTFVLGIDSEVVAAAMEVVHRDLITGLAGRGGELGWRFMDKFVQLPFLMPRLTDEQRRAFVETLLHARTRDGDAVAAAEDAVAVATAVRSGDVDPDAAARQLGSLTPEAVATNPAAVRKAAVDVVVEGATRMAGDTEAVVAALGDQLRFLSDNPRTIKRAVNLYRFYSFTAWAREVSPLAGERADQRLIARWVIVLVRWPSFVRWLQTHVDKVGRFDEICERARRADGPGPWRKDMEEAFGAQPWQDDALWDLLTDETHGPLDLRKAAECGLW